MRRSGDRSKGPAGTIENDGEATVPAAGSIPATEEAYAVGYGKPPAGTRFQPGRSGNPKGRPRKNENFETLLRRELDECVSVKERGRHRTLSKRKVLAKLVVREAMAGSPKHLAIVLSRDPIAAEVANEMSAALTGPPEETVKAAFLQRLRTAALDAEPDDRAASLEADLEGENP